MDQHTLLGRDQKGTVLPTSSNPEGGRSSPSRVLLIEDNPGDADLVREGLEADPRPWHIEHVSCLSDGMAALRGRGADVVLLDLSLPDSSGLEGVRQIVGSSPQVPVVVLTGMSDASAGTHAVQEGAQEYLIKGELDPRELGRVLSYAMERHALALRGQLLAGEQAARVVAERAHRRARLLADASIAVSSTLEEAPALAALARVLVPRLGACCTIERLDARARDVCLGRIAGSSGAPRDFEIAAAEESAVAVLRASCTQGARIEPAREPRPEIAAALGEPWERLDLRTSITVPLLVRGQALGTLALFSTAGYDSDDLLLAEEIARRACGAVESARLYAQALDAIQTRDNFLSIAGHELRTPLGSILVDAYVLERLECPGEVRAVVERISRCAGRLNSLTNDLLDISRIRAGRFLLELSEVELGALVREVVDRSAPILAEARSELRFAIDGPVCGRWDRSRVQQVVGNLLQNAARYGAGRPIELAVEGAGKMARLRVRDHGCGIDPADQKRIFEQFSRPSSASKVEGLGLGLWITKGIVEAHGGTIAVQSSVGAGAEFVVELPSAGPNTDGPAGGQR